MPELECPLELTSSLALGLHDYVWEPGIPAECRACFHNLGVIVSEKSFDYEDDPDVEESIDLYYCLGVKATGTYDRLAAEDTGIDDSSNNYGPLTSRTIYEFKCPKPNLMKDGH